MKTWRSIFLAIFAAALSVMNTGCAQTLYAIHEKQAQAIPATGKPSLSDDNIAAKAQPKKSPGNTIPNAKDVGL